MLADSPARGIALLYLAAVVFAMTHLISVGDNFLLRPAHIAFALCVMLLMRSRGFVQRAILPIALSWKGALIAIFLAYVLLIATFHWDREVSASFVRTFFDRLLPGMLLGYVVFGRYGRIDGWLCRQRHLIDFISLTTFGITLLHAANTLFPLLRNDIFLIASPEGDTPYQLFGIYLIIGVIAVLRVLEGYWSRSIFIIMILSVTMCFISALCFLLAQAVGSNLAAVLIPGVAVIALGFQTWRSLRTWTGKGLIQAAIIASTVVGSYIWMINVISSLPPIRLFGFVT